MSSGYWQTRRQKEQFKGGRSVTQRVAGYIETWEGRCYSDGLPDSAPEKISKSGRVPSYKAIALAILKNDHNLHSIGFADRDSVTVDILLALKKRELEPLYNLELF